MMIRIAVDGMGGDYAPKEIVLGTLLALERFPDIEVTIFGDEALMKPYLKDHPRLKVVLASEYFDMGEKDISRNLLRRKEASMIKAMYAVKDGLADVLVSAGPTQVLVFASHFIIRPMEGMERIAIAPLIPTVSGKPAYLMDAGANIDAKPEHLVNFALFATISLREVFGVKDPKVGLINIGTEPGKGRDLDKDTYKLLSEHPDIHFYGNLEPKEVLTTDADILLSDGFTANIVMKTMEGSIKGVGEILKREIKRGFFSKIGALFMRKALKNFKQSFSQDEVGGALIAGLDKAVIKAHGSSSAYAFSNAIRQAKMMIEKDVINKVKEVLSK
jgi:glycerol-3-phosphate acyltransferase PlsX